VGPSPTRPGRTPTVACQRFANIGLWNRACITDLAPSLMPGCRRSSATFKRSSPLRSRQKPRQDSNWHRYQLAVRSGKAKPPETNASSNLSDSDATKTEAAWGRGSSRVTENNMAATTPAYLHPTRHTREASVLLPLQQHIRNKLRIHELPSIRLGST